MIKLLHVDDDTDILEIARISLEFSGDIEVVQCSSGEEALAAVAEFIPDVFLLDVMMPGMTGPKTLEELRKLPGLAEVPAIFMTARANADEHKELWDVGALEVISKPFDPMSLSQQIKAVLANRLTKDLA
ncbi:Response regulator receiver domain-containing protein [Sulfitobacter brevis]|uniref:Response regulator receiver domain-containing protein n=1 Tax=Sulfitobacter brevis TaxID=74348 RepID=A0A1I1YM36_9RHOB|nr:response regulator [Sulfitobacter brevis]SFE20581.1 Response regulator receiver domain-containing protein [Sulfitobacter brevis]